jgi:hypothetical protein
MLPGKIHGFLVSLVYLITHNTVIIIIRRRSRRRRNTSFHHATAYRKTGSAY